jgi:N-acetylglucosaminyl-diphospho-decaprenol L-rhamnosyltransferase
MKVLLSIVSHGQGHLVFDLLSDLNRFSLGQEVAVILTVNFRENLPFSKNDFFFPLTIQENEKPRGFAANHNAAFRNSPSDIFAILNPDLRLIQNPLPILLPHLTDPMTGLTAPKILNGNGKVEDSARCLPTPYRLLKRVMKRKGEERRDYLFGEDVFSPDWVAGIFLMLPSPVFAELKGFDENYYLYFEDVDLCCRLRRAGYKIILDPRVTVVHNARRESHRSWQYLKWHLCSGMRFFFSPVFWDCWLKQFRQKDTHPF